MAHALDIWLFGCRVGTLECGDGRLGFQYRADWLSQPQAVALSVSLPLQAEAFDDARARPFFAGLLLEPPVGRLLAQAGHRSASHLHGCIDAGFAGAITLMESGQALAAPAPGDSVHWLGVAETAALLETWTRQRLGDRGRLCRPLETAQGGLPVVFDGARIGLPRYRPSSSHVLRPAPAESEDPVANEWFCMSLAMVMGLRPAAVTVHRVKTRPLLLAARYDCGASDSGPSRQLHQEDFCQALGVLPEMRCQHQGGPDLAQCFALLREMAQPCTPQLLRLLDYVIFNALIGNDQAHAGSYRLLYFGKDVVLAPLDGAWSTAVHASLELGMAMKIGSSWRFAEIRALDWVQFARERGFDAELVRERVLEMAQALPAAAWRLQMQPGHGFAESALLASVVALIGKRCDVARRSLDA